MEELVDVAGVPKVAMYERQRDQSGTVQRRSDAARGYVYALQ